MNISLTPELEEMVKAHVKTGRYNSSSEVIREALRVWQNEQNYKKKLEALRTRLAVGELELDRCEGKDGEKYFNESLGE